jgi:serine/threonine-protein kinase
MRIVSADFNVKAEVLASLNHPNIASIYDLQEANCARFLVLELVEGETLSERIARGPIAIEDAVTFANEITAALEAAHGGPKLSQLGFLTHTSNPSDFRH